MTLFSHDQINLDLLRKTAFNYRWASLEPDVIPLTAADPDFPVAKEIPLAIQSYVSNGYFSYGSPEGNASFKEAISMWYSARFGVEVNPDYILPVNSAAFGLFTVAKMIAGKDDEVIIPNPVDFLFRKAVEAAGAGVRTCLVHKDSGEMDLNELSSLISPATKAIFVCNPNNPLGKRLSKEHLNALIDLAIQHDLWIVSDEIWADISFDGKITSLFNPELRPHDKKLVVSGLSKNFALAGLRIGYVLTQNDEAFSKLLEHSGHSTTAFGIPVLSQIAGAAAFNQSAYWLDAFLIHLNAMKKLTEQFISEFPYFEMSHTDATYLAFPKLKSTGMDSKSFVELLHKDARVALVPGGNDWFESASEGHVRICFATSKEILETAFERMLSKIH
jgi:aminotransferase/cystathionine beta-lyase